MADAGDHKQAQEHLNAHVNERRIGAALMYPIGMMTHGPPDRTLKFRELCFGKLALFWEI